MFAAMRSTAIYSSSSRNPNLQSKELPNKAKSTEFNRPNSTPSMEFGVARIVLSMPMPEVKRGEYGPVIGVSSRKNRLQWELQYNRIRRRHEQAQGLAIEAGDL
jgi:hypothetical protein